MIKNYLEMDCKQKEKFYCFENRNKESETTAAELDKMYRSLEYDGGTGVLAVIENGEILGKILVILKECKIKGKAYVVRPELRDEAGDRERLTRELIMGAKELAREYGADRIFLGTMNNEILKLLNLSECDRSYHMQQMVLSKAGREKHGEILELVKLDHGNVQDYLALYNDSFHEVPSGASLTEEEVQGYVLEVQDQTEYYIARADGRSIGFLQLHIEEGIGELDLGVIQAERGKGYGRRLLQTAISCLNEKMVRQIRLIVASSNVLAYEMYQRRGFQNDKIIGQWFELV